MHFRAPLHSLQFVSSGQPTSQYILASFLESAFTPDDFIAFLRVREHTARLVRHLSDKQPSARFFPEASLSLAQHGLVDREFFAALIDERPARKLEIQHLEAAICAPSTDGTPTELMERHKADAELEVRLAIPIENFTVETLSTLITTVRSLTNNPNIITVHIRAGSTLVTLWCTFADLRVLLNPRLPPPLVELGVVAVQPRRFLDPRLTDLPPRDEPEPRRPAVAGSRTPSESSQTRKLVGVMASLAVALALMAIAVFQLVVHMLREPMALKFSPISECTEDGEPGCGEGKVCRSGRCIDDVYVALSTCQAGDACGPGVCDCGPGLDCENGSCAAPPASAPVCEKPEVLAALTKLRASCAGDFDRCPPQDLKRFAIENPAFDRLLGEFPGTLTLHFPTGAPPIAAGKTWPTAATREHYLQRLAPAVPHLAAAEHIFIIARTSSVGDPRRNEKYAQTRSRTTKDLILEATSRELRGNLAAHNDMRAKFADFMLGREKPVTVDLFRSRYANRAMTWSDDSERMLRDLLNRDKLTPEDALWLDRVINQVVFVVPIPCELPVSG